MSILPSNNSSNSSSSSHPSQSPYANHGYVRTDYFSPTPSFGSLQISEPADLPGAGPSTVLNSRDEIINPLETTRADIGSSSHESCKNLQHQVSESGDCDLSRVKLSGPVTSVSRDGDSTSTTRDISTPAGKKHQVVSGNHLLNFRYDPISRPYPRPKVPPPRRSLTRKPYNKDLFLQANFKFVLLDTGNYASVFLDPDKMIQWEDIICVKYLSPLQVHCPICLDNPLCPQITSCGHIFCFPCILQYLMMGEDDNKIEFHKKCPLCFMMVSSKDLHTINIQNVKQHSVGDAIELVLLARKRDSFVLSLKNNDSSNSDDPFKDLFSKFTFTLDVELSVRSAFMDLDSWLARADSGVVDDVGRLPYVCAAIRLLEHRKEYWNERQISNPIKALRCSHHAKASKIEHDACECVVGLSTSNAGGKFVLSEKSKAAQFMYPAHASEVSEILDDNDGASSAVDFKDQTGFNGQSSVNGSHSYVFYQAVDGQHLILHPLNMKCLMHHYGCFDQLPNRIRGKILQLESVTQSEATRRRYRFLSHFSISTSFQFCEIDLRETLPPHALSPFMHEIKNRETERKRLARKEHREKIKAESAELLFTPIPVDFQQEPYAESPTFSMDDFEALGSSRNISTSPPLFGQRQSFSNVAKLGFAAGHDSPALRSQETHCLPKNEMSRDLVDAPGAGFDTRKNGAPSFSNVTSKGIHHPERSAEVHHPERSAEVPKLNEVVVVGRKGKKPNRVLLSTAGARRY